MNALIISAIMGVLMMFSGILLKEKSTVRGLAFIGLLVAIILNVMEGYGFHLFRINVTGMMNFDKFSLVFNTIAMSCTLIFFLLSAKEMEKVGLNYSDYFALIFFILCGIFLSSSFSSLLILFLGIEIISIPLYILTGSDKRNLKSNEASLKYFLLGSFSTGLMLMGIALIYGGSGSFAIDAITNPETKPGVLLIAGLLLLMFSMAFKASAAPFHFWTPDVYDGAPTVFTSFMATIVKAAVFIAFIRLFYHSFSEIHDTWKFIIAVITALTLFIGNITAVFQQSVKKNACLFKYCASGIYVDGCTRIEQRWYRRNIVICNSLLSFYYWSLRHFGKNERLYVRGFQWICETSTFIGRSSRYFSFIISGYSIDSRVPCKILYDKCRDQQRWFSLACYSCSINGGN